MPHKRLRRAITWPLLALALLAAAALAGRIALRRMGITLSLDGGRSLRLLDGLATGAGLDAPAGPAEQVDADGTTPDTAVRDYRVPDPARARRMLAVACRRQRLRPPGAEERRLMPDIACAGRWRGRDVSVHWSAHPGAGAWRATLEVRAN